MRLSLRRNLGYGVLQLPERSPLPELLVRIGWAVGLILMVAIMLWFQRDGMRDNTHPDRPLSFTDVFYYTVVSLTTVGYGDIIPVTQQSRLFNALFLTPIRVVLWALFLGTAYELLLQRYREKVQMQQLRERLSNHTIVCGYGVKGRAIVTELLSQGHQLSELVIIDPDPEAAKEAAAHDLPALCGDPSTEAILHAAAVEKAGHVLVAPNRDDACVLICLTVRTLAPHVRLVAAAREEENVKLLYKAGADVVVAPSVSGGRLMAAAVRQKAVTAFLEDLLEFGAGVQAKEYVATEADAGKPVTEVPVLRDKLVLGVARQAERCPFYKLTGWRLAPGDAVVYLAPAKNDATLSA